MIEGSFFGCAVDLYLDGYIEYEDFFAIALTMRDDGEDFFEIKSFLECISIFGKRLRGMRQMNDCVRVSFCGS